MRWSSRVGYCVVAASEGIRTADKQFVADAGGTDSSAIPSSAAWPHPPAGQGRAWVTRCTGPRPTTCSVRRATRVEDRSRAGAGGRPRRGGIGTGRAERSDAGDRAQRGRRIAGTSTSRRWRRSPTTKGRCRRTSSARDGYASSSRAPLLSPLVAGERRRRPARTVAALRRIQLALVPGRGWAGSRRALLLVKVKPERAAIVVRTTCRRQLAGAAEIAAGGRQGQRRNWIALVGAEFGCAKSAVDIATGAGAGSK